MQIWAAPMKRVFTILFFLDTLVLIVLSYFFFHRLSGNFHALPLLMLLAGILASIGALAFFLWHYWKLPSSGK
jgi:hypothetical protein